MEGQQRGAPGGAVERGPGARGLASLVLAPGCEYHTVSRVVGADLVAAAAFLEGRQPTPEGSMIAVEEGERWEAAQRANGGRRLLDAYRSADLLPDGAVARDLERECGEDRDARRAATARFVTDVLSSRPTADIVFKPLFVLTIAGRRIELEPDGLVRHVNSVLYRPLEIKTLRDQAAQTPRGDLAMIRLQAGAEVLALRAGVLAAGPVDPTATVPPVADLILRSRVGAKTIVRPLRLVREVTRLTEAIGRADREVPEIISRLGAGVGFDTPERAAQALELIPTTFSHACFPVCPLAKTCYRGAVRRGDSIVLGDEAGAFWDGLTRQGVAALLAGSQRADSPERQRIISAVLATRDLLELPAVDALVAGPEVLRAG